MKACNTDKLPNKQLQQQVTTILSMAISDRLTHLLKIKQTVFQVQFNSCSCTRFKLVHKQNLKQFVKICKLDTLQTKRLYKQNAFSKEFFSKCEMLV